MTDLKIAVLTGGHGFEVQPFHTLFRTMPGVDAYIQHIDDFVYSPEEVRDGYDAVVFYIMPGGAPKINAKRAFERLGETGQGIVMLHHAFFAYPGSSVFNQIIGVKRRFVTEYKHDQLIPVELAQPDHPILQGVTPWTIHDETYVLHSPGLDSQTLLTTDHPDCIRSLAWTRSYHGARVFCYQSGHDHKTYNDPNFRTVLTNGIRWTVTDPH